MGPFAQFDLNEYLELGTVWYSPSLRWGGQGDLLSLNTV
jgi:hypothetical protein